jgi:hypothetical protein
MQILGLELDCGLEPAYELLWVKIGQNEYTLFIGVLYHPLVLSYQTTDLLAKLEKVVLLMQMISQSPTSSRREISTR